MTTERALKTLSKYAEVKKTEYGMYYAIRNDKDGVPHTISFYNQGGEAICLHTKRTSDQADSQSDYFPGSFPGSMKKALRWAWSIESTKVVA